MTEKNPYCYNFYIFRLYPGFELADRRFFPNIILDILAEKGDQTFLVASTRGAQRCLGPFANANPVADQPSGEYFSTINCYGEDVSEGTFYLTSTSYAPFIYDIRLETEPVHAEFSFDTSPRKAWMDTFPKWDIHGPALTDSPVGVVKLVGGIGAIPNVATHDIGPQWSICRMDMGLSILERVDLDATAYSIAENDDYYYVLTEAFSPPQSILPGSSVYYTATNPNQNVFLRVLFVETPKYFHTGQKRWTASTGGEIAPITFIGPFVPMGNPLGTPNGNAFNLTTIATGFSTAIDLAYKYQNCSFATEATNAGPVIKQVYTSNVLNIVAASITIGLSNQTNLFSPGSGFPISGGGCAERVTPRVTAHKLNKLSLESELATEWDADVFARGTNVALANTIAPTNPVTEVPRITKLPDGNFVVGWQVAPKLIHSALSINNSAANTVLNYYGFTVPYVWRTYSTQNGAITNVTRRVLVPIRYRIFIKDKLIVDGNLPDLFTTTGTPDPATGSMPDYTFSNQAFKAALANAFDGPANIYAYPSNAGYFPNGDMPAQFPPLFSVQFVEKFNATYIDQMYIQYYLPPISPTGPPGEGIEYLSGYDGGQYYAGVWGGGIYETGKSILPMLQGGPGQYTLVNGVLTKTRFYTKFNLAGKFNQNKTFRIRGGRVPPLLQFTTRVNSTNTGVAYTVAMIGLTAYQVPRFESFKIRYRDKWSDTISFAWPEGVLGVRNMGTMFVGLSTSFSSQNYLSTVSEKFATEMKKLTGLDWTIASPSQIPLNLNSWPIRCVLPGDQTNRFLERDFEIEGVFNYTGTLNVDSTPTQIASQMAAIDYYDAQPIWTDTPANGPVAVSHNNALHMSPNIDPLEDGTSASLFDKLYLDKDFKYIKVKSPEEYYPRKYRESYFETQSFGFNQANWTKQVWVNTKQEYFTNGISKYDASNNLVKQTDPYNPPDRDPQSQAATFTQYKILNVDQFDTIAAVGPSLNKVYFFDRDLVCIGIIDKINIPINIATDRNQNYYMVASLLSTHPDINRFPPINTMNILKYNQYFQLVDVFGIQASTTSVYDYGGVPKRVKCIGDNLLVY